MPRIRYKLGAGLSRPQIESIHKGALRVIEKIGIDVPHEKTLKQLAGLEGVRIKGTRVCFSSDLVNESTLKRPLPEPGDGEFEVHAGVYCLKILDFDGNTRPAAEPTGQPTRQTPQRGSTSGGWTVWA